MSDRDELRPDEAALLTGAYALNALEPDDRTRLEAALATSEELRTEVTGLSDTAVLLGLSSRPVDPSPQAKDALMALLDSTPQLSAQAETKAEARTAPDAAAVPSLDAQRRIRSLAHSDAAPRSAHRAEGRARARWFSGRAAGVVAAAAAALVIGTVGGIAISNSTDRLGQLQAADDIQTTEQAVEGGGTATVLWSEELHSSAVIVSDLPALDADEVYQLWYVDQAGDAVSAGTLDANGTRLQLLDGERGSDVVVAMSVEPSGGSEAPTTTPIMVTDA